MNSHFSIKEMCTVAIFTAITAVLSQISIPLPFSPVPITMQVLAIYLSSIILGSKLGTLSQIIYILLGIVGIPVFANFSGGLSVLVGPTGGFLISFPIIAFIIGKTAENDLNFIFKILGLIFSLMVCYFIGTLQFIFITNMSIQKSIALCVLPYIPLDIVKIIVAYILGYNVRQALLRAKLIKC
ncbi:MAG: biotin transporter BioY [Clostridium sp.]|uniref:biotin transporter BioY n=1 Tax=Clostridium sp. TaxID=1506 RepID=UPI0025C3C891|nr:biotin transporter BioY [Clostridium sp.]MCH3965747.1 biotin transporter BioY [Clostridium sp.]MCI1717156.1 biotin transporter BioY [Clostridium sp.]MCI1801496.1 biotin transporter BioY [Clostridium sp.]MCI1815373.1 biotin transporter BioY [Clostridium sp.]MCI1872276.1 biotin transporter BioY [Clostridium sp.]